MEFQHNLHLAIDNIKSRLSEQDFESMPDSVFHLLINMERERLDKEWFETVGREAYLNARRHEARNKELLRKVKPKNEDLIKTLRANLTKSTRSKKDESQPIHNNVLNLYSFRKETILNMKEELFEFVKSVKKRRHFVNIVNCFGYFGVESKGRFACSSHLTNISQETFETDIDRLFSYFDKVIEKVIDNNHGYEGLFTDNSLLYTTFVFKVYYTSKPRCISNWDMTSYELDLGFCKLFCANNVKVSCINQCSNRIWGESIDSLSDFLSRGKDNLVILNPKPHIESIKDINSYYDLEVCDSSPIKNFSFYSDKFNFVLLYKDHIGVLHSFKRLSSINNFTSFTPLKSGKNKNKVSVCFDIECYFDPNDEMNQVNIPYLCCFCFIINDEISDINYFKGKDCILNMLEYVSTNCEQSNIKNIELVAHNGGNYDFHYIISSLFDSSSIKNILIRNNSFISFTFPYKKVKFHVKDSYSFLLCSLAKAAKAFLPNSENAFAKTDFPHHKVKSESDLDTIYKEWDSINEDINVEYEKDKMIITSENIMNYSKNGESKKLIDWSIEYCKNDVLVLAKVWIEFKRATFEIFGADIVDNSFTLAGMSFNLFKAYMDLNITLHHPEKLDYLNMRSALYGGRCVSFNGIHDDVVCLDVKSLYPAAMAFYDQPYGSFYRTKFRPKDELGVYYVTVVLNPNSHSNFFPIKDKNNNISYIFKDSHTYQAWYTTVDIDIGIQEGHIIEYTPFDDEGNIGYSWTSKGKIFKSYIQNVLYKYKLKFEKEDNKVKRNVIKIIMNSLWGKFAQKWIDKEYCIKLAHEAHDTEHVDINVIWNTEYVLITSRSDNEQGNKPIQNGLFTLSWARWHMKQLWDAASRYNSLCLYSDTDSIFVRKSDFDLNAYFVLDGEKVKIIGNDIGQLELEVELDQLICAGKKQYIGFKKGVKDNKPYLIQKCRFKGIPSKYIVPDMYSFLLESADNKVYVKFIKFNRIWGAVRGYMETKTLQAT
nr:DNA polymerase [Saccharomycopsis fibuligera]WOF72339.1 DNA polymerase [Saccharomycopsis fibuligera]WOF72353.1 DNA polymerase [Saccharomycopsis fibuligera]